MRCAPSPLGEGVEGRRANASAQRRELYAPTYARLHAEHPVSPEEILADGIAALLREP